MTTDKLLITTILATAVIAGCQKHTDSADTSQSEVPEVATVHLPVTDVRQENVQNIVNVSGVVAALPDHSIRVSPAVAGKLVSVLLTPGQKVHKGQVLARLDNRQLQDQYNQAASALATTRVGVEQASINLTLAKNTAERTKRLVDLNIAADKDLVLAQSQVQTAAAQLEAAKSLVKQSEASRGVSYTQLGFSEVKSPIDGVVAQRFLNTGDTADSTTPILQIVDLKDVIVTAFIPVVLPARIVPGETASITCASLPNQQFHGAVTSISPVVDSQSTNIPVQIRCANSGEQLKEGMPVSVAIITDVHARALTVPNSALVADPEAPDSRMVYLVVDQKLKRVKVTTGIERDGRVEVIKGLKAGQAIVAKGAYGLPDGTQIEAQGDQVHKTSAVAIPSN